VWIRAETPALVANGRVMAVEHWKLEKNGKITKKANIKS